MTSPEPAEAVRAGNRAHGFCAHGFEHGERGTVHTAEGWKPMQAAWTDEQVERFAAEWRRKYQDGTFGHPRLLTPLPRRVRLRLAVTGAVDSAAIWLCDHRMRRAAGLLWWRR